MIKVLVSSLSRDFGGVESLFLTICKNSANRNLQFDFVCSDKKVAQETEFIKCCSKIYYLPRPHGHLVEYTKKFFSIVKNNSYQVYHVNLTRFRFPLDIIIARMCGLKIVLHCHSTRIYSTGNRKNDTIRWIQQKLFRTITMLCSNVNIACSKSAGEYLFHGKQYEILYNGIELEKFKFNEKDRVNIRREFNISKEELVIGHIGRFSAEKNHEFLLRAFKDCLKENPSLKLMCVGDGDLCCQIKDMCKKMNIVENVIFTGVRKDIPALLSAMDLFVFPSIHEALPITLIEAQANGLHCIVSESVTREIDVLDSIEFLTIDRSENIWARKIGACCKRNTVNLRNLDKFNIDSLISDLIKIYMRL